ncbi:MAG: glutamine-hydrolyzing carbamoyl-phosphate synthase small subunit [Acidobacteriota bacterium]|nr:glutamine-hydrolyzing carbamoyl-phosphate synthase small subunit [Acidobacteriota bacterium]
MKFDNLEPALLVLEDGTVYEGTSVAPGTSFGEVVFNTSMTGYQEILTDPSYRGQIVVMTQPHMGNYGTDPDFDESRRIWAEGFVGRRFTAHPDGDGGLADYLSEGGVPGLAGIDTRALVRRLRIHGALRGVITSERFEVEALLKEVRELAPMTGRALVDEVTCSEPYEVVPEGSEGLRLAVYDFGVKQNILRCLARRGVRSTVLPARTPASECLALGVDGIVLSNGPGDPEPLTGIVENVAELAHSGVPVFGICLGHQLLGLSLGAKTFKMKFGHHGGNQPVRDEETGKVTITSQNHGFAVDPDSLPASVRATEINLNDGTLEAFVVDGKPVFSVQYHPEAAPGPNDAAPLFDHFLSTVGRRAGR